MKLCVTSRVLTSSGIGTCVTNKIGLTGLPACSALLSSNPQAAINKRKYPKGRRIFMAISLSFKVTGLRQCKMKGVADHGQRSTTALKDARKICTNRPPAQRITLGQYVDSTYKWITTRDGLFSDKTVTQVRLSNPVLRCGHPGPPPLPPITSPHCVAFFLID